MRRILVVLSILMFSGTSAFAGALTVEEVLERVSTIQSTSLEVLKLLSERNLVGTHCDLQFHRAGGPSILCNADDNSVIALIDFWGDEPTVEHRPDEQVNPGPGPVR